jgi:hypothetical protein
MKKIFLLILLVFEVGICQNKFTFAHCSVSDCYNGYQDVFF